MTRIVVGIVFALALGLTFALDRGMLTTLSALVQESTDHLEAYDYARVLERTETFFWAFCDDYLELVSPTRTCR